MSNQTKKLRQQLRAQRRHLSVFQQRQAERQVLQHLQNFPSLKSAQHIGIYLDDFGEIATGRLIQYLFSQKKTVYLPLICNMNQQLRWVKISRHQYHTYRFFLHRLGMYEPMANRGQHISRLDLVLMPLLACDHQGTRMGMGGGFYDRTLASAPQRPYRVGLAHDFQLLNEPLTRNVWDQALDALVSPSKCLTFRRHYSQYKK